MSDALEHDMNFGDEPVEFSLNEIVGEQVVLRPLGEADAQSLFELIDGSREFLSEHLPWPAEECRSPEDVSAKIDAWDMQVQMANGACWGIFEKVALCWGGCSGSTVRQQLVIGLERIFAVEAWRRKRCCWHRVKLLRWG